MKNKKNKSVDVEIPLPEVSANDMWLLLLSTVRYSMGRQTYMPSTCVELYNRYRNYLTAQQREQIAKEIEAELAFSERLNQTLGAKCDHETWREFAKQIRSEKH